MKPVDQGTAATPGGGNRRRILGGGGLFAFVFGRKRSQGPAPRFTVPGLAAYYWDGSAPKPHRVLNISESGALLAAPASWPAGTVIELTLQLGPGGGFGSNPPVAVALAAQIVRSTPSECAIRFLHGDYERLQRFREFLENLPEKELVR